MNKITDKNGMDHYTDNKAWDCFFQREGNASLSWDSRTDDVILGYLSNQLIIYGPEALRQMKQLIDAFLTAYDELHPPKSLTTQNDDIVNHAAA